MTTNNTAIVKRQTDWLERLESSVEDDSEQYKVVGIIVGGFVLAGVTSNPLLGAIGAGLLFAQFWKSRQRAESYGKRLLEVKCVSPSLGDKELFAYRRQFGDVAVLKELLWAEMEEIPLKPHALDFLDWMGEFKQEEYAAAIRSLNGDYIPVEAEAIAHYEKQAAEQSCQELEQEDIKPEILGNDAIDFQPPEQARTQTAIDRPMASQERPVQAVATKKTAFQSLIESPYLSRAFFGAQRTGKTYLAAIATQELARRGNNIYHINLASYGDEDKTYWSHAKSVRCDLASCDEATATDKIQKAIALVEEWFSTTGSILVVDEWAYIGSIGNSYANQLAPLIKLAADKISALASTGIKRSKAIWTIAPEFVAGGLTQDAKSVKKLQLCFVSIAPGKFVDWQGSKITFDGSLFDQINKNFPIVYPAINSAIAGRDRIVYINNLWMPTGTDGIKLQEFRQTQVQKAAETITSSAVQPRTANTTVVTQSKTQSPPKDVQEFIQWFKLNQSALIERSPSGKSAFDIISVAGLWADEFNRSPKEIKDILSYLIRSGVGQQEGMLFVFFRK